MTKHPKTIRHLILMALCLFTALSTAQTQVRGQALYELLRDDGKIGDMVSFEGISHVRWMPDGKSYIISENGTFKKVNTNSGKKSKLFNDRKLIAEYNKITGENTDKLPFQAFTFIDDGKKIKFSAAHRVFLYTLKSTELQHFLSERPITGVRGRIYREVFSPNLKYRAYTRNYNLYLKDTQSKEEALTGGGTGHIRKGFPDWVYPEELDL